jgi:predicted GNAT superfamily acetyltransferase
VVVEEVGEVVAFLLAFRERASYDSINYQWFARRYRTFLYVDRVVTLQSRQRSGAGRLLYEHVFAHAKSTQVPVVTCEYDVDPPNPGSAHFHARFGFYEVGRQVVSGGKKSVSLQAANVSLNELHEA